MTKSTPSSMKKIVKVPNQAVTKQPKRFLSFVRQASSELSARRFLQHFTLSSAPTYRIFASLKFHEVLQTDH